MRKISTILSRSALGAVLIGLAGTSGAQAVDIKMWTLVTEGYPEFVAYAAEEYKKTHPDVNIIYENFPNEAYKTTIQVALTGSEPPDVFFNWAGEDSARLVRDGLALDITEYGSAPGGFATSLGQGWLDSFAYDGRNYGVPTDAVSKYVYYNTNFFDEHGLEPTDTFEGLLQLCRDIRAIDPEIVPMPVGNSERWKMNHFITTLNQRVLGNEATAADYALTAPDDELFTNPGYADAWQTVLDMQDAGCFEDAPNATSPEATWSMFSAEVTPMAYCGTWCASIFNADGFEDFAMFRFPAIEGGAGDPGAVFLVPQGLQVSSKSEHPQEAAEWISFLVSDEMAAKFAEFLGAIVSNPAMIDTVEGTEQYKWFVNDIAAASGSYNVLDVLLEASVANAYLDAGVEVLNGTMTPEEAMEHIRGVALEAKAAM